MPAAIAEVLVGVPHLVALDRLPCTVTADAVTVELDDDHEAAGVVGSLRATVRRGTWRAGRRDGAARVEIMRTHADRCALTVVFEGLDLASAYHLALAARRSILDGAQRRPLPDLGADRRVAARPATRPA